MKHILYIITILIVVMTGSGRAQYSGLYLPRTTLGANGALFRISLDEFTKMYQHRFGPAYGAFAGMRIFSNYYAVGKYSHFEQHGRTGIHETSGLPLESARWQQDSYMIGLRNHPPLTAKTLSYFGFGLAYFYVIENDPVAIFRPKSGQKDTSPGSGFYLELGIEHFITRAVAAGFELEISSGGLGGRTGFEALSVGGFRFALGLTLFPF